MNPNYHKPPRLANWLLKQILPSKDYFILDGDFEETYNDIYGEKGGTSARFWYWKQVIISALPLVYHLINRGLFMVKNYVKLAYRNTLKNKVSSLINVLGLSAGITCSILIYLFIENESQYDRFHRDAEQIFLPNVELIAEGGYRDRYIPNPLGPVLTSDLPEVTSYLRLRPNSRYLATNMDVSMESGFHADSTFFAFFDFPLKFGDPAIALKSPFHIVLSDEVAAKYFGEENPVGKSLQFYNHRTIKEYIVSGVTAKIPDNSSIKFGYLIGFVSEPSLRIDDWKTKDRGGLTFIKLKSLDKQDAVLEKIPEILKTYNNDFYRSDYTVNWELKPLVDYHFDGSAEMPALERKTDATHSIVLSGILIIILTIVSFNFVNLFLAGVSSRFKEVGMRKILGARKSQIIKQFLSESVLLGFISAIVGIVLAKMLLPSFNSIIGKDLVMNYFPKWEVVTVIIALILFVAVISGLYPILVFSKFKAIEILKNRLKSGAKNNFKKPLIGFQFGLSVLLLTSTLVMYEQFNFIFNRDLGYESENVIIIPYHKFLTSTDENDMIFYRIKNLLLKHNDVRYVSGIVDNFSTGDWDGMQRIGMPVGKGKNPLYLNMLITDEDFIETYGAKIIKGSTISKNRVTETTRPVLVNEKFLEVFKSRDPIGKTVSEALPRKISWFNNLIITGVVKNFHYHSLKAHVEPVIIDADPKARFKYIGVKISGTNVEETIDFIKAEMEKVIPGHPFSYSFLEDDVVKLYQDDRQWAKLINLASITAIILACSGLFGLTLLTINSRIKEIGIRKTLGSTTLGIVRLVNKDFLMLLLFSNIVAWPLAYYIMDQWLQTFAYRTSIGISAFILAGFLVITVAIFTISIQALRGGLANPVDSLRYE